MKLQGIGIIVIFLLYYIEVASSPINCIVHLHFYELGYGLGLLE